LAAEGRIDFPTFLFSNVGDDSEHPKTLEFVRNIAIPWGAEHGINVIELHKTKRRTDEPETLWGRLMRPGSKSLPIPVRMADTGAPGTRSCTADFKIRVIAKWLREHGASEENPAIVAVGFSTDEIQRAGRHTDLPYEVPAYPLLDLRLDRQDCIKLIERAGLPVPPKSACFFCPFHRPQTWAEQRRDEPELFAKAVYLERTLNERRDAISCHTEGVPAVDPHDKWEWFDDYGNASDEEGDLTKGHYVRVGRCGDCDRLHPMKLLPGDLIPPHTKDHVFLTRFGKPLDEAIAEAQPTLFSSIDGPETCDEGYCWT
jgi:hypothetical protein